tara:strand:+ start:4245 stop:4637 length:393 start_codon:yes stop_codon:yes gene_type:complete
MKTEKLIEKVCEDVKNLLIKKNRDYGDSALNPSSVFSKGDVFESLGSRIDDKLMRIQNVGVNDETEDTISDLIGYLILYKVALIIEKDEEYNSEKEIIENGGYVTINGRTMGTVDDLDFYYSEKKEENGN